MQLVSNVLWLGVPFYSINCDLTGLDQKMGIKKASQNVVKPYKLYDIKWCAILDLNQ